MGGAGDHLRGALVEHRLGRRAEGAGGVDHVVDQDRGAALDVADHVADLGDLLGGALLLHHGPVGAYPAGEVAGHILGFTSVDDEGQEGLELAFDHWLAGENGAKRVIQDRYGTIVQNVEEIRAMRPGRNLVLSIDLRIQYLAYRELKAAIRDQRAKSGSIIVLDVATGEVLAMVNQPTYNPNDRDQMKAKAYRNRAVTDIVEPGSSIKPFFVAAGLASGRFDLHSIIDTNPGYIKVGAKLLEDPHNLGAIGLATILAKSSNVGMTKVAL